MPITEIHVLERLYGNRADKISSAIQEALINTRGIPTDDFFQLIFEFAATASASRQRSSA